MTSMPGGLFLRQHSPVELRIAVSVNVSPHRQGSENQEPSFNEGDVLVSAGGYSLLGRPVREQMSILDGLSSINALFPLQLERRQTITLHHLPFPESRRHDSSGSDISFFHSGSATSDYLLSVTPCNTPHARGMAWAQTHEDSQLRRLSAPTGPIRPAYDPTSLTTALPAPSFPISGRLAGVGLRLSEIAPHRVVEIAHNGPACQSDAIRVHDILLAVDDVACAAGEVSIGQIRSLLVGEEGTMVSLTLLREFPQTGCASKRVSVTLMRKVACPLFPTSDTQPTQKRSPPDKSFHDQEYLDRKGVEGLRGASQTFHDGSRAPVNQQGGQGEGGPTMMLEGFPNHSVEFSTRSPKRYSIQELRPWSWDDEFERNEAQEVEEDEEDEDKAGPGYQPEIESDQASSVSGHVDVECELTEENDDFNLRTDNGSNHQVPESVPLSAIQAPSDSEGASPVALLFSVATGTTQREAETRAHQQQMAVDAGEDDNSSPSSHKEDLSPETACGWCVRDMQSNIIAATIDPSANDTDTAQEGVRALSLKEGRHGAETAREKAYKVLQSARSLRERDLERRRNQTAASATAVGSRAQSAGVLHDISDASSEKMQTDLCTDSAPNLVTGTDSGAIFEQETRKIVSGDDRDDRDDTERADKERRLSERGGEGSVPFYCTYSTPHRRFLFGEGSSPTKMSRGQPGSDVVEAVFDASVLSCAITPEKSACTLELPLGQPVSCGDADQDLLSERAEAESALKIEFMGSECNDDKRNLIDTTATKSFDSCHKLIETSSSPEPVSGTDLLQLWESRVAASCSSAISSTVPSRPGQLDCTHKLMETSSFIPSSCAVASAVPAPSPAASETLHQDTEPPDRAVNVSTSSPTASPHSIAAHCAPVAGASGVVTGARASEVLEARSRAARRREKGSSADKNGFLKELINNLEGLCELRESVVQSSLSVSKS